MIKKYCDCFLEYENFKDDLIEPKLNNTNVVCVVIKVISRSWQKNKKKRFFNSYKLSNYDNNKFILLLPKGGYP